MTQDCRTLLEMKDALACGAHVGDGIFSSWSGYRPISEWTWTTVEGGRVRALEYTLGGIWHKRMGTIPPKTAELTELRTPHIRHNELGSLSNLEFLYILRYNSP